MICGCCGLVMEGVPTDVAQGLPRAVFDVPKTERDARVFVSEDICGIDARTPKERAFLRAVLSIPINSTELSIGLGLWVEMPVEDMLRITEEFWESSAEAPSFHGQLSATVIPGIPDLEGIKVRVKLQDKLRPKLIAEGGEIALVQKDGVAVPEWHAMAQAWGRKAAQC